jgi:hypothetical protein
MTLRQLSFDQSLVGMPVIETDALPTYPSPAEEARRIVRNGLSDLTFGGAPIVEHGPGPRDATHGYITWEGSAWNPKLHASPHLVGELVIASRDPYAYSDPTLAELVEARAQCLYDRKAVPLFMASTADDLLEWARALRAQRDIHRMLEHLDVRLEPWQQRWAETAMRGEQYASFSISLPRQGLTYGATP